MALYEDGRERQLSSSQAEGFPGQGFVDAVHFIQHLTRLDLGNPIFGVALAVTHPHFGGFLGNRLVREDAYPDAAAPLDVTSHGATGSLNLPGGQTAPARGLQTIFTETDLSTPRRQAGVAAFLFLTILPSRRLQHHSLLASCGFLRPESPSGRRAGRLPGRSPGSARGARRPRRASVSVSPAAGCSSWASISPL